MSYVQAAIDNMNDGEMFGRTLRVNFAKPMKISEGSTRPVWARYDRAGHLIVLVTTLTLLVVTSGCRSMLGPVSLRAPPTPTRRTWAWCPPRTAARRARGRWMGPADHLPAHQLAGMEHDKNYSRGGQVSKLILKLLLTVT